MKSSLTFVVIPIIAILFYLQHELLRLPDCDLILGELGYNVKSVQSPAVSGYPLQLISFLFTKSILGTIIMKLLMKQNNIYSLVQLSYQMKDVPPLHFPMQRLSCESANCHSNDVDSRIVTNAMVDSIKDLIPQFQSVTYQRSIVDYIRAYEDGKTLPSKVAEGIMKQARAWEVHNEFPVFSFINETEVMESAYQSDERYRTKKQLSIFDGIPIGVKDMINVKNHKLCFGLHPNICEIVSDDDVMVRRFRELGAIIIGTTIMVEGGVSPLGYNSHWKGTFNAYNREYYSGGSSSGSAAAVASGLVPMAIGFDGGGSIRIPSTMSGLHGLATTFGRCPYDKNLASTMIKAGPMTNSALDTALFYSVMSPSEHNHFYSQLYGNGGTPTPFLDTFHDIEDLSDVRIGIYREWFEDADDRIVERCYEVLDYLKSKNAEIVEISIPHFHEIGLSHGIKISSEFSLAFDKIYRNNSIGELEPNTRITVATGHAFSAVEILAAETLRSYMFDYVTSLFDKLRLSAIITPTTGVFTPKLTKDTLQYGESNTDLVIRVMRHIAIANFLGLPGYTVPVGFVNDTNLAQLPVGFQFIGNHWTENILLRLGHSVERGFTAKRSQPRPKYFFDPLL